MLKNLSIKNEGISTLILKSNKLKKLELKANLYQIGRIEILNYNDCDSLDVDIEGENGSFIIGDPEHPIIKENPKQWLSIKVPATLSIKAESSIVRKIIIKK